MQFSRSIDAGRIARPVAAATLAEGDGTRKAGELPVLGAAAAALLDALAIPLPGRYARAADRRGVVRAFRPGPAGAQPTPAAWLAGPLTAALASEAVAADDPLAFLARRLRGGERTVYALAAAARGLAFRGSLDGLVPASARLPHPRAAAGLTAVRMVDPAGTPVLVVAPPPGGLLDRLGRVRDMSGVVLTTPRVLDGHLQGLLARRSMEEASCRLSREAPDLSARRRPSVAQRSLIVAAVLAGPAVAVAWPALAWSFVHAASALSFTMLGYLRMLASAPPPVDPPPAPAGPLPAYTVLVALYREARMVPGLVEALDRLDYPRDRLEIRFLLEADDGDTIAAVDRALVGRPGMTRLVCPPGVPRTKPRALCLGLMAARGDLVTVYDAEDRPHPGQLRAAAAAFAAGPAHLACLQARLDIDRVRTPLQRQFAIEYLVLFDGILPWLARWGLPMPLGGTSNHFKRAALDAALGWDPWNVTEDADLGFRLMRFGYSVGVLDSATREDAPARRADWLAQRRRWIKGWMVTFLVHDARPWRLVREMGWRNAAAVQVHALANVVAPLCHPAGLVLIVSHASGLLPLPLGSSFAGDVLFAASVSAFALGYGASIVAARRLLMRRGRRDLAGAVWLMPLYWLLGSWAAWRALAEVVVDPHRWAKTPHEPHGDGATTEFDEEGWSG